MKPCFAFFILTFFILTQTTAQHDNPKATVSNPELPYYQIPPYPETYNSGTVAARIIDGLGFRYYWATEGLRDEDLKFKPSEEARTSKETLDHIYGLSRLIVNAASKKANEPRPDEKDMTFEQTRAKTLQNLKKASDLLKDSGGNDMTELNIIYKRGENTTEFPFWNVINGPIADAIWHVGQIVSFRRSSGNPFNSKVSVFNGKLRE